MFPLFIMTNDEKCENRGLIRRFWDFTAKYSKYAKSDTGKEVRIKNEGESRCFNHG